MRNNDKSNLTIQITDLTLVTTLTIFGFSISSVDLANPSRVIFEFENSESTREIINKFWKSKLTVEPRQFNHTLRELKAQIRNEALPISK